jgi:hypothetical protein
MGLNNSIDNPIASWAWLLGGMGVASAWLGPRIDELRRKFGFWGFWTAKTASPEEKRFIGVQAHIFLFFGGWLVLYLILDFIF